MTKRIDVIGQNGADGRIYLIEKLARRLAGKDPNMMLSGRDGVRRRWEDFVPFAIELLEIVEEHEKNE